MFRGDSTVGKIGFKDGSANLTFARSVGGYAAVGKNESGQTLGRERMQKVLHSGVIGVPGGRHAEFTACVFAPEVAATVAHSEARIGEDVVGLEIFMHVAIEAVGGFEAMVAVDAPHGEVHSRQPPHGEIARLSEDSHVGFRWLKVLMLISSESPNPFFRREDVACSREWHPLPSTASGFARCAALVYLRSQSVRQP